MAKEFGINSFTLKIIAVITMLADHLGAIFFPQYVVFRYIGRLAFPIYCFLLAEGFFHTGDVKKYELRLLVFAVISEIPFDLAMSRTPIDWGHQNVFFTLFFGVLLIDLFSRYEEAVLQFAGVVIGMALVYFLKTDYNIPGLVFILVFYLFYGKKNYQLAGFTFVNLFCYGITSVQSAACLSILPIGLYNGKKGPSMKYFFYAFYPVHLLILYFISCIISGI